MATRRPLVRVVRRKLGRFGRAVGLLPPIPPPQPPRDRGRVAVVIPAHNESQFLAETLDCLRAQTYPYWRAIVVDDQSHDTTTQIAARYARDDSRVEVRRLRRNAGLPAARNAGLSMVTEPFVLFLDGDDILLPGCLEARVGVLVEDDSVVGAYGQLRQVPVDVDWRDEAKRHRTTSKRGRVSLVTALGENPFSIHEVLLRTRSARALGGFDESLRTGAEDLHFWVRALRSGMEFIGTGQVDALYRQRPISMMSVGATDHMTTALRVLDEAWRGESIHSEVVGRSALDGDLGEVQRRALVESRLLRYLGMVGYSGESDALEEIKVELAARAPFCLSRKAAEEPVRAGLARSRVRAGTLDETIDLDTRSRALVDGVAAGFQLSGEELSARSSHASWAVLVENRAQAALLTRVLSEVPTGSWPVFLCSDTVDADMGAVAFLQEQHPDAVAQSVPKFLLDGVVYDLLVIPAPVTWVGRLVSGVAHERGIPVQVVQLPWSDSVVVDDDEAQGAGVNAIAVPAEPVTVDELTAQARTRSLKTMPRRHGTPPSAKWPGRVDQEGVLGDYGRFVRPSVEQLLELRDRWRGQRAVVIGNGPSLNQTDLDLLKGVPTFGVNGIYYADDRLPEPLTFYVVEDTKVFEENTADVLAYGRGVENFLLPTLYRQACTPPEDDPVFFRMNGGFYSKADPSHCRPRFSTNAAEVLYCGQSVTIINLQLAYWFGFSQIGLIGMDFSYTVPTGTEVKGNQYTSAGDDPNHFDPRYFGAGKTWKDPKLNRVLANYELAKTIYESDGRRIMNCTVGGRLEAFDRVDLADFVRG